MQDKCGGDQLVIEGDFQNVGDLEKEVIELASETEVLKKSAPEGNDESNIQYFLAIAELEKTNKILRQQEIITNDNLKSLDLDIEGTQNDLEELKKLKEMKPASVTEKNKVRIFIFLRSVIPKYLNFSEDINVYNRMPKYVGIVGMHVPVQQLFQHARVYYNRQIFLCHKSVLPFTK